MADDDNHKPLSESAIFPWLQSVADLWLNMAKTVPPHSSTLLKAQAALQERVSQQLDTNLNMLKSLSNMMKPPQEKSATANVAGALPEIFLKIAKSGFDTALQIQNHLMEKAGKIGKRTEAYSFENLDQDAFRALNDVYEKEIQQYFKIPPLV